MTNLQQCGNSDKLPLAKSVRAIDLPRPLANNGKHAVDLYEKFVNSLSHLGYYSLPSSASKKQQFRATGLVESEREEKV